HRRRRPRHHHAHPPTRRPRAAARDRSEVQEPVSKQHRTLGGAIVYALVFAALLGLTGLAILATQARSTRNAGTVTNRALERATADAAIEHGKALVQQAIGAQAIDLEQLADLDVTNDQLNGLEYRLDLSLAPYGDIRADLVGTREWAAARLDPL